MGERCLLVSFVAYTHTHTHICLPLARIPNGGPHCLPSCQSVCNVYLSDVGEIPCLTKSPRLVKVREFGLYRPVMFGICCWKASSVFVFVSIGTDRNGVIKGINIFGMRKNKLINTRQHNKRLLENTGYMFRPVNRSKHVACVL